MKGGKAAGVPCIQLDRTLACKLFGHATRPAVCSALQPSAEMCGQTREQAIEWITRLERLTTPGGHD